MLLVVDHQEALGRRAQLTCDDPDALADLVRRGVLVAVVATLGLAREDAGGGTARTGRAVTGVARSPDADHQPAMRTTGGLGRPRTVDVFRDDEQAMRAVSID